MTPAIAVVRRFLSGDSSVLLAYAFEHGGNSIILGLLDTRHEGEWWIRFRHQGATRIEHGWAEKAYPFYEPSIAHKIIGNGDPLRSFTVRGVLSWFLEYTEGPES